uniref:T9SS type A sorting domain-containing protein n=1 Tax=candidate division WOR-3 bacterium TaxID=2052148 RepID=A0A7C4TGH6_UNCW3
MKKGVYRIEILKVLVCGVMCINFAITQPGVDWQRTFGGDFDDLGREVQQTEEGGYIIVGYTRPSGSARYLWLLKANATGIEEWDRTYNTSSWNEGYSVQQTLDGGYVVVGWIYPYNNYDVWFIKTDAQGNLLWEKTFGGPDDDEGYCVQQTADSGYIITGRTGSYLWLIKTDANGDTIWTKTYNGKGYFVQQTIDGGYIITGATGEFIPDVLLLKTDAQGNELWNKTYVGRHSDEGYCVQQTADTGYIVVGVNGAASEVYSDLWLIKTDPSGDTLWTRSLAGEFYGNKVGRWVQQTENGYIITGYGGIDVNLWLIKTDFEGNVLWDTTFDSGGWIDKGYCVQQTADGGYIITGLYKSSGELSGDLWLIKMKPETGAEEIPSPKFQNSKLVIYPNPFSEKTEIMWQISERVGSSEKRVASIKIYDVIGVLIKQFNLTNYQLSTMWDGTDDSGRRLPAGVYFCQVQCGDKRVIKKVIMVQ